MEYFMLYLIIFTFGAVIGSFLNVCIYRIPERQNLTTERSHCMSCGNVLKWYELIPIVSYVLQRGRCRHCGAGISIQYPLVEALNGLLYVWIVIRRGQTPESALFALGASALIVLSVIDWRTYEIPFGCNLILGGLGFVRLLLDLGHWQDYVIGFFAVSLLFWIIWLLSKGTAMGGGDIKLMAAAGLLLGWQGILIALGIGSIAGAVLHSILMKWKKKDRVLAFGPYLAFGILCAMLYGEQIIGWYLR